MKFSSLPALTLASLMTACIASGMIMTSASPALAASAISILDTDKDGTVDLAEAKAAAGALFDELDVDHDGAVDHKELEGRISAEDWKLADPDNDKTIRPSILRAPASQSSAETFFERAEKGLAFLAQVFG
jgi:EF hand